MLRQTRSTASKSNPAFTALERADRETNTQWGERAVREMQTGGSRDWTYLELLGGRDTMAFRLRVAQSQLRRGMLPSYLPESIPVELTGETAADAGATHGPLIQPDGAASGH